MTNNKIAYSAPAKLIITGEHASVYGKPTLISALNLRLTFSVEESKQTTKNPDIDVISKNVREWLTKNTIKFIDRSYVFSIKSDIPPKKNLGSSAALSVAASAAFLHFYTGHEFPKDQINQAAYISEKHFHGNPSGGDNSTSCFGGLVYFRKEFEFLKNISSLSAKIPKNIMDRMFIIDSGDSVETTGEMVALVGRFYNADPKRAEQTISEIEKVTKRIVIAITTEDTKMFAEAIGENEKLLETLGTVSEKTKRLLSSLSTLGVGKVTGGGGIKDGSGNLLFFANSSDAERELKKRDVPFRKFAQDFEGVRLEV